MIKSELTEKGYILRKEGLPFKDLNRIKKDLMVSPFVISSYGQKAPTFPIYLESIKKIYLPKFYGLENFGEPKKTRLIFGDDINIKFTGELREKQKPALNAFMTQCNTDFSKNPEFLKQSNGGIVSLPCGYGKTILALYLITLLKKKTIVIVHKDFLISQWKERIEQFIPDAKVGTIQGPIFDIEGKDIVLAMLQSLSMKEFSSNAFDSFGFTIIDECHHIAAEVFSRSLPKINSYYSLGLSATPKRKDGLSKVFHWFLGPMVYEIKQREDYPIQINNLLYSNNDPEYLKEELNFMGKVCAPKMINKITENPRRTIFIVEIIKILLKQGKKILVLSDRRQHLADIYNIIEKKKLASVGYYVGGMKQEALKKSENNEVLLGTFTMSSEGMDIPDLDAVIFASPKSDIIQSIGRILRKKHKEPPVCWDITDNKIRIFQNQSKKRSAYYKKMKYPINNYIVEDDIDNPINQYFPLLGMPVDKEKQKKKKKDENKLMNEYCFQDE